MAKRGERASVASGDASVSIGGDAHGDVVTNHIAISGSGAAPLPLAAAKKDLAPIFRFVGLKSFTGREWLADRIARFIAENHCGYVFIEADAGLGKTAFAVWLVQHWRCFSHFSRFSGGRSVQAALQNLSAQIISEFGLAELAPGGFLPEWVQTPSGFESLLGIAARRSREPGTPVILVLDGLDEADRAEGGLPFGLPLLLPDGVYVIGTHRTGFSPGRPDCPAPTMKIRKEDERNRNDVRRFLVKEAAKDDLASRLADAGMAPANFVELLAERCGGVWIYLKYVLEELRIRLRDPKQIGELPPRLRGYYASQIRRWEEDPSWDSGILPLLATLGVSGEALPADTLARLSGGLDPASVRHWCDFNLRPFLATPPGTPRRYEIYHESFRDVLREPYDDESPNREDSSDLLPALAAELRQAHLSAHSRIADSYLTRFGGISAGLPTLAAAPGMATVDDGYPLRHLARHLELCGRTADLHRLLAVEQHTSAGRALNVWFVAHDSSGHVANYLADVARAWGVSRTDTNDALRRHQQAATIGTELRYALMGGSIGSLTANVSAELLGQLLRAGIWSADRALDHASRLASTDSRLDALLAIRGYVGEAHQESIIAQALFAANAIADGARRARVLTGLAPGLKPDQLRETLAAATNIPEEDARSLALAGLGPFLGTSPALVAEGLNAALALSDPYLRAETLVALAPCLPADDQPGVMAQALAAANAVTNPTSRAAALAGVAVRLPANQQATVVAHALAAASTLTDPAAYAEILADLAPHLGPDQLDQALAAAVATTTPGALALAIASLAPSLPPAQVTEALAAASVISDPSERATAMTSLAPCLPPSERDSVLMQAMSAATSVTDDAARAEAVIGLAPHITGSMTGKALKSVIALPDARLRASALAALAPHVEADQRHQVLAAAVAISDEYARSEAIAGLAAHLRRDELRTALTAAIAVTDREARAIAIGGLAPYLPSEMLSQALSAAAAIADDSARAEALAALSPHLPPGQQDTAMTQALAAALSVTDPSARAGTLAYIAPYLPPGLLAEALADAIAIAPDRHRAGALVGLAPYLPPGTLGPALEAGIRITNLRLRIQVLTNLAPYLPPGPAAKALEAATAITNDGYRAEALSGLAPHLSPDQLTTALASATALTDEYLRAVALISLAPHMAPERLPEIRTAAETISDDGNRSWALGELSPHLDRQQPTRDQQLAASPETFTAAHGIIEDYCSQLLNTLAPSCQGTC